MDTLVNDFNYWNTTRFKVHLAKAAIIRGPVTAAVFRYSIFLI
jgi:hypothetical protein